MRSRITGYWGEVASAIGAGLVIGVTAAVVTFGVIWILRLWVVVS